MGNQSSNIARYSAKGASEWTGTITFPKQQDGVIAAKLSNLKLTDNRLTAVLLYRDESQMYFIEAQLTGENSQYVTNRDKLIRRTLEGSGSVKPFASVLQPLVPADAKVGIRFLQLSTAADKTVFPEIELSLRNALTFDS